MQDGTTGSRILGQSGIGKKKRVKKIIQYDQRKKMSDCKKKKKEKLREIGRLVFYPYLSFITDACPGSVRLRKK